MYDRACANDKYLVNKVEFFKKSYISFIFILSTKNEKESFFIILELKDITFSLLKLLWNCLDIFYKFWQNIFFSKRTKINIIHPRHESLLSITRVRKLV